MSNRFEQLSLMEQLKESASRINFYVNFLEQNQYATLFDGALNKEPVIIITIKKNRFQWDKDKGLTIKE